jgi:1,4-alpha-glucan branching enzyme
LRPELHDLDFDPAGFSWIDCHDADQSVLAFERRSRDGRAMVAALNFTPVVRADYRIGLPLGGAWAEVINSDSRFYGGSDIGNQGTVHATAVAWMGRSHSAALTLPPLAGILLGPCP